MGELVGLYLGNEEFAAEQVSTGKEALGRYRCLTQHEWEDRIWLWANWEAGPLL